ncbi:MAG: hypothetical protein IJ356_10310 [Erysipelotrichaceae bacterium]|nr:hypothetical protein [Erysipelotrichaceae bacterium]
MSRKWKHIPVKGLKIALGTVLAIVIAELFHLQYAASAGTVALLTLLTTKTGTVKLIVCRLLSFVMTVCLSYLFFNWIPFPLISFFIVLILVALVLVALKWESALSVNALIAVHFLTELDFSAGFIINELMLVLVGVVVAFVLNLVHHYTAYEDELDDAIVQIDHQIQELLTDIVVYIRHPNSHSTSWGELGKLEKKIQENMKYAMEYDENVFSKESQYYLDYFEVREFQCEILHLLHYEIRKIRTMPEQAEMLAAFLEYLIPYIYEEHDPEPQLTALKVLIENMKELALPQTREEFENRAILYHIFMDIEDFLLKKKQFIDRLDSSQKILHWKK